MMKSIWNKEPVMVSQIAALVVSVAAVFGLSLTLEQSTALVSAAVVVAGLIGRSQVSPTT